MKKKSYWMLKVKKISIGKRINKNTILCKKDDIQRMKEKNIEFALAK